MSKVGGADLGTLCKLTESHEISFGTNRLSFYVDFASPLNYKASIYVFDERAVVIFSKTTCCMYYTIKILISNFGENPMVYELDEHPNGQQMERELKALGCKPSVPAVFLGQELIGGPNEIMSLHLKGELVPLLKKAKAIWL